MEYRLIYSKRTTIGIQITTSGEVVVRAPKCCSRSIIESILNKKKNWIQEQIAIQKAAMQNKQPPFSAKEKEAYRREAKELIERKAKNYSERMQITYHRITIREQKTRWGSCSSKGNLNFNWRLILAPESVLDYVVIHELAHLIELNHSSRFYQIVERWMPDYRTQQEWLRKNGKQLWLRE